MPDSAQGVLSEQLLRANEAFRSGRYDASLDAFRDVLAKLRKRKDGEFSGQAHFGCALSLLALGDREGATYEFEKAFRQQPPHIEGGMRWGEMLLALGRLSEATRACRSVLSLTPDNPEVLYCLGACFLRSNMRKDAKAAFESALRIAPDYGAAIIGDALLSLFGEPSEPREIPKQRPIICVLLSPYVLGWLGGQTYLVNFVQAMMTLPRHRRPRLLILVLPDEWRGSDTVRDTMSRLLECEAVKGAFDRRGHAIELSPLLERWRRRHIGDDNTKPFHRLFAKTSNCFPLLYPTGALGSCGRPVYWIPDFQHHFLPANFAADEIRSRSIEMIALAEQDMPIIFSSHDAASHFRKFYQNHKARAYVWNFHSFLDKNRQAADGSAFEDLGLPSRYYYTPNQFWPHKGHATLFHAARLARDRGIDLTIVCTGSDLARSEDPHCKSLLNLIDVLKIDKNIRLLGVLSRSLQFEVLRRSCAVIQPSLFEGWSTVIEDARAIGRPVVASDIAVHIEQLGPAGHFFRARDAESLADAIASIDAKLSAGPDSSKEALARDELKDRLRHSAEQFLQIIQAERARMPQRAAARPGAFRLMWSKLQSAFARIR